ncbi:class I SAM-dependent methyltransferase [candidate division KSB1 bacterium]|nr:class I SAM-dependent methyltransferase [candidate division KSB1 bacterium]
MTKPRVVETNEGIHGEFNVTTYDQMQRRLRDKGWIETGDIIKSGITSGRALEVGPGPGYLGLEWLKHTQNTTLTGLDISADMLKIAKRNAADYQMSHRVNYIQSSGQTMPFGENEFDAVFTNGSLHEWEKPMDTFSEMWRVLKSGGKIFISDLRRDMSPLLRWFLWINTRPKSIRPGLITSIDAAYTPTELRELIKDSPLAGCQVSANLIGVKMTGIKDGDARA